MFQRALLLVAILLMTASPATTKGRSALSEAISREAREGFSGSVLVVAGRDILADRGIGSLHGRTFKPGTRYWIASMGKQFVSALLVQLQDEGKLSLSDTVGHLVPDAPEDKRPITLLQLLSHTSGLPQGYEGEAATDGGDAIRRIMKVPLTDKPGAAFHYSNENYHLAAAIAERVGGQSYGEMLRTRLLRPLGLRDTGLGVATADRVAPTREATPERLMKRGWGIEGTYSTTHDLLAWYRALRAGRVVSAEGVRQIFTAVAPIQEGSAALGWFLRRTAKGTDCMFTRGNDDFGPNALLYAYPARDVVIVVLSHAGDKTDELSYSRSMLGAIEAALGL